MSRNINMELIRLLEEQAIEKDLNKPGIENLDTNESLGKLSAYVMRRQENRQLANLYNRLQSAKLSLDDSVPELMDDLLVGSKIPNPDAGAVQKLSRWYHDLPKLIELIKMKDSLSAAKKYYKLIEEEDLSSKEVPAKVDAKALLKKFINKPIKKKGTNKKLIKEVPEAKSGRRKRMRLPGLESDEFVKALLKKGDTDVKKILKNKSRAKKSGKKTTNRKSIQLPESLLDKMMRVLGNKKKPLSRSRKVLKNDYVDDVNEFLDDNLDDVEKEASDYIVDPLNIFPREEYQGQLSG